MQVGVDSARVLTTDALNLQATGCGKTHTISGSAAQPGIVFLIMKDLFARIAARSDEVDFSLTVSYLEIYNETIRDLLAPESGVLQLRDSQEGMATPANLSTKEPTCAHDVVEWITLGNSNRTVNFTEANATSSRSHAVLRVTVTQKPKGGGLTDTSTSACLSVIDLAGSERASVTKNRGERSVPTGLGFPSKQLLTQPLHRLNEGANINRSLLALGNCINALCDPRKRGHVPYRDSKLTRLLKQSLGGNCKTVMIVCVSPSSAHYDETHNTLQYANRAKEIKTKAIRNVISVDRHVAQYCQQIMEQQQLIDNLKRQIAEQNAHAAVVDRAEEERALQTALRQVQAKWNDLLAAREAAERRRSEESLHGRTMPILEDWRKTVQRELGARSQSVDAAASIRIEAECDTVVADFSSKLHRPDVGSSSPKVAQDAYDRASTAARSALASRPGVAACLDAELRSLDARLESSCAGVRAVLAEKAATTQAEAIRALGEVLGHVLSAKDIAAPLDLAVILDKASRSATAAFVGAPSPRSQTASLKRDSSGHSLADPWRDLGSSVALSDSGQGAAGPTARRSPKKPVSLGRSSPERKKAKTVQWSDDIGEELEEIKYSSPALSSASSTPSFGAPSPRPSTQMWTLPSTFAANSDSSKAAELMALKASTAMRGSNRPLSTRPPTLAAVTESPSAFSLLRDETMPPPPVPSSASAPRSPFADLNNSSFLNPEMSFSMAPSSTGLVAPLVSKGTNSGLAPPTPSFKQRRTSHIGPMRSEKAMRRLSVGNRPPRPSLTPDAAGANTMEKATMPPPTLAAAGAARRPARLATSSSSSLSVPSLHLPPASARKSPRKPLARAPRPSMQPTARRLSTMPTGLAAAAGMQPTTAAPVVFGGKSAARIAARRESRLSGGNTSGNGSTILANLPHGTPASAALTARKDSPSGSAWR